MAITTTTPTTYLRRTSLLRRQFPQQIHSQFQILRCVSYSKPKRGFGPKDPKANKVTSWTEVKGLVSLPRKSTSQQSGTVSSQPPRLSLRADRQSNNIPLDLQFEERLEAVKRSALEQKKAEEIEEFVAIEYDAPVESESGTVGLGTKIGVGVAVVVFGLIFALGDFLPSESPIDDAVNKIKMSETDKVNLQTRLQQYKATLKISPEDSVALEGEAVTLAELGEYTRAASLLEDLIKKKPRDPDAFRLLGEVKYELQDYEGSAAAYKSSAMMSNSVDFEVLRGLTNALLAAKKPDEAVQILLVFRKRLNTAESQGGSLKVDNSMTEALLQVDPIQVELLLGKAYSDWGHVSDAVSVYDQLISSHPDDFRGYLAKGIISKENGNVGAAERMFIQARFFAPERAKVLVDRYSRQ